MFSLVAALVNGMGLLLSQLHLINHLVVDRHDIVDVTSQHRVSPNKRVFSTDLCLFAEDVGVASSHVYPDSLRVFRCVIFSEFYSRDSWAEDAKVCRNASRQIIERAHPAPSNLVRSNCDLKVIKSCRRVSGVFNLDLGFKHKLQSVYPKIRASNQFRILERNAESWRETLR